MISRHCFLIVVYQLIEIYSAINGDNCNNRQIDVFGFISPLAQSFFALARPEYENTRKINNRINVSIKTDVGTNAQFTTGLTGYPDSIKPLVFFVIHSTTLVDDKNELRFPLYGTAVVIVYNLPGVNNLNLTLSAVAEIYKGSLTNWNDTRITKYNPNAAFPNKTLLPLARSDSDASTGLLTQVLTANDEEWATNVGVIFDPTFNCSLCDPTDNPRDCCVSTLWPKDVIYDYVTQVVGMVGRVISLPYTVGYVPYSSIAGYSISQASIIASKTHNNPISCSAVGIQSAISYYLNVSGPNDLQMKLMSRGMPDDAYPFTNLGYMGVNHSYDSIDCCSVREIVGFINWLLFQWDDQKMTGINFIPVVDQLKRRIETLVLKSVVCGNEFAYAKYIESNISIVLKSLDPWTIVLIVALVFFAITTTGCYLYYVYYKRIQADESRWIIPSKRIKISGVKRSNPSTSILEEIRSVMSSSFDSRSRKTNSAGRGAVGSLHSLLTSAQLDDNKVFLDHFEGKPPQQWKISSKRLMSRMRNLVNKNVSLIIGATVIDKETFIVSDFFSKGTLHYVLRTARYSITDPIKYQFAIDVAQAMKFLHQRNIVHGQLSSLTCYLDSSWTVKVAQWEQLPLYLEENPIKTHQITAYNPNVLVDEIDLIKFLYVDCNIRNKIHEFVDVFSFGFLLVEIFTRQLPYNVEIEEGLLSYTEILSGKFNQHKILYMKLKDVPSKIVNLSKACIGNQSQRPLFPKILSEIKGMTKITSGIVDIIMDTLESHAEKLEEKVEERTAELKEMTDRMRILLNEVLPPQIATKLFNGEPVPPEFYECVTVYFSDIVGFTTLSARSTPIEVMTLLNDLWLAFDSIIDKYDVYKVDTIGDAYMVCSGLPNRNGMLHCEQVALLALHLLEKCNKFKIKHLPDEQLKIRIGINSGPVTAGIVGSKMPQYCVFGDTVNTSARMESTSEPQKIQISDVTQKFLGDNFPEMFDIVYRGETCVKGKGMMSTYWLLGKKMST